MTKQEAALYLRCSENMIKNLIKQDILEEANGCILDDSIMELTNYAENVYTIQEVAKKLGFKSEQSVRDRIKSGEITAIRLGRIIRIIDFDEKSAQAAGCNKKPEKKPKSKAASSNKSKPKTVSSSEPEIKATARSVIDRMEFEEIEVLITITKMDTVKQRLIKDFIKAYLEKKEMRKKIDDLLGLME